MVPGEREGIDKSLSPFKGAKTREERGRRGWEKGGERERAMGWEDGG